MQALILKNLAPLKSTFISLIVCILLSCSTVKPELDAEVNSKKISTQAVTKNNQLDVEKPLKSNKTEYVLKIQAPVDINKKSDEKLVKVEQNISDTGLLAKKSESKAKFNDDSYSNYIRVKTVYELATDANPPMFLPHDEFETSGEYQKRVSEQVKLMKEIVLMTSQKMDIKKAQRLKVAKEKEAKQISLLESLMSESASQIEFAPTDIGRYNPEKETFPIVLHDTQYQISVPREEARTFKSNFRNVKIKGIKQLKPKYDVSIKVFKAHIRSRPNGSIVGIASQNDYFEHVQDEDEWYKINYKGQFGFTHMNNAELKLVDIDNKYEYHDLVAIHPTTGSMFAMTSVDKLVKAPLNLASRKLYESGQPDGPK